MCDVGFGVEMTVMVIYPAYYRVSTYCWPCLSMSYMRKEDGRCTDGYLHL
jgi:hypothetical protein